MKTQTSSKKPPYLNLKTIVSSTNSQSPLTGTTSLYSASQKRHMRIHATREIFLRKPASINRQQTIQKEKRTEIEHPKHERNLGFSLAFQAPHSFCSDQYYKKHRSLGLIKLNEETSQMMDLMKPQIPQPPTQQKMEASLFRHKVSLPAIHSPSPSPTVHQGCSSDLHASKQRLKQWLGKVEKIGAEFRKQERHKVRSVSQFKSQNRMRIAPEVVEGLLGFRI